MWRLVTARDDFEPGVDCALGKIRIQPAERRGDVLHAPTQYLLERPDRHRQQYEVASFTHIETARAGMVPIAVIHQCRKIPAIGPRNPALLQRRAVVMPRMGV